LVSNLTLRRRKGPGTAGDLVAIAEPNIILIDSESSNVTQIGVWSKVEESEAVGGSYLQSNTANSKLTFSFKGSTLWIRFRFGPDCGKAKVEVDSLSVTIDLYYALELYKYVNVAVGLKENETHNVTLTVLGEKNSSSTDYYVKVDSFAYRLTEEALSLHSIEYIDLINVINTINRINQIELINNIANISLIQTISDVHGISSIGNVVNVANISLIQTISEITGISNVGTVNKINAISDVYGISNIGNIANISSVDKIDQISTIDKINELSTINTINNINTIERIHHIPIPITQAVNGGFETGDLTGWVDPGGVATVTTNHSDVVRGSQYCCKLAAGDTGIVQYYSPPIALEDIVESSIMILAENPTTEQLSVKFLTTDGSSLEFSLAKADAANTWYARSISDALQLRLQTDADLRKKHFYAIILRNIGDTDGLHIDDFTLLTMPLAFKGYVETLSDSSATVASGSSAELVLGTVNVFQQILAVSLEYQSSATLYSENTVFNIKVDLLNTDGSVNERYGTLTYTPPNRPGTTPMEYNFYVKVPSGVSKAKIYAYFYNDETTDVTIYIRNVKAYPILDKTIANVGSVQTISTVEEVSYISLIQTLSSVTGVSNIGNIANISLIQALSSITGVSSIGKVNTLSDVYGVSSVGNVQNISLVQTLSSVTGVSSVGNIANISNVQNISLIQSLSSVTGISNIGNIANISLIQVLSSITGVSSIGKVNILSDVYGVSSIGNVQNISLIQSLSSVTGISTIGKVNTISTVQYLLDIPKVISYISGTATASGDTAIVTPPAGFSIRVKLIDIWNNGTSDTTVGLRFGTGTIRFKHKLSPNTGFIINLVCANWQGDADEALYINLDVDGTIDYTIGYELIG